MDDESSVDHALLDYAIRVAVDRNYNPLLLSGMESIPRWQTEVARLEGMGLWSRIYQVWYPGTRHLILFAGIFLTVEGIASFSGAYVLLGGSGGILDSGLLFVTYLYQVAFPGGVGDLISPLLCR